jgi:2-polyprenyl-3-methyl-5-hydroxy-6-metoxy-1,4-benzoquinol methylase
MGQPNAANNTVKIVQSEAAESSATAFAEGAREVCFVRRDARGAQAVPLQQTCVELACGSGFLARRLIEYGVASYLGIDFAETAIAKAREPSRLLPVRIWTSNR